MHRSIFDHSIVLPLIEKKKECEKKCDQIDGQLDFLQTELAESQRWDDIHRYQQIQMSVPDLFAEKRKLEVKSAGYRLAILSHDLN